MPARGSTSRLDADLPETETALTGAEAIAKLLADQGVRWIFGYPGTSELALCAAIARTPRLKLMNARGDKEAVLMAAGVNVMWSGAAVGLLHGARGLTNALGAIADTRRSEFAALHIVGMASRASAAYNPPHAEPDLIQAAGAFARAAFDCSAVVGLDAMAFLNLADSALEAVRQLPGGPVLLGVPQDLLEARFIPPSMLKPTAAQAPEARDGALARAIRLIESARSPVLVADDYMTLHGNSAMAELGRFATAIAAPVFQLAYRRGPMLFERLHRNEVPNFVGLYRPGDSRHQRLLADADLVITIEDRNMYPRVVGSLPTCPKIAITGNPEATAKNGYLSRADVLLAGHVPTILARLNSATLMPRIRSWSGGGDTEVPEVCLSARMLVQALTDHLHGVQEPILVDDSQMLGGLIANNYDLLPAEIRVFGSHGGFIGGGLAMAAGVAIGAPAGTVLCLVGDQGFTNGIQALAAMAEHEVAVVVVVCNNGTSRSLGVQAQADGIAVDQIQPAISNCESMSYTLLGNGYGLEGVKVSWPCNGDETMLRAEAKALAELLTDASSRRKPFLVEVVTGHDEDFWSGVWNTVGHEASPK